MQTLVRLQKFTGLTKQIFSCDLKSSLLIINLKVVFFQMYRKAMRSEAMDQIPYYWHTNYALACEHMLRFDHSYSKASILNETIFHFEMSVKKNPTDKDVPAIKQSIDRLKTYIGKIK